MRCLCLIGAILCIGLAPWAGLAQPTPGDVVINEIMYAPTPSTNEFLELYNRSESPVNLSQLSFADDQQDYTAVTPEETTLAPGEYAVLVRDPEAFEEAYPSVSYLTAQGWDALNNGGDTVYLRHTASDTLLDSVPYSSSWGGSNGRSLERVDPGGPSDTAENFASSESNLGATPNAENSVYNPDETPPSLQQVTPSRDGDTLKVSFSEPLDASTVRASAYQLDGSDAPSIVEAVVNDSISSRVQCILGRPLSTGSYTLVATSVADRRGNVLAEGRASFSFFDAHLPRPGDVIISEIMYAPSPASNEFVELYNRSNKTFDLSSIQYADDNRDYTAIAPPFTAFEPDSYVVLARDPAVFEATFPDVEYIAPTEWAPLNNGGDTPIIRHEPSETPLDSVPYAPSWGGSGGSSLERIDPNGPSDEPANFASSMATDGATPGAENSRYAPDTTPPSPVFAEQAGASSGKVIFSEPIQSSSVHADAFELEEVNVIEAHLQTDSIAHLSLSGTPTGSTLTVVGMRDRVGNVLDEVTLPFAYLPSDNDAIINEFLFDPLADNFDDEPNQVEFVELRNVSDRHLTLNGLLLTDRPTEQGSADTLRAGRPRAVPPEGFVVVAAAPTGVTELQHSQLAEAFPEAPLNAESVRFLPIQAAQLGLDNNGDLIRVHRADGTIIAEVEYDPDWHAPGLAETKGTTLERISPTADGPTADNWTSSTAPDGGTPGAQNAVSLEASHPSHEEPGLHIQPSPFSIERDGATRIQYTLPEVPNLVRVRIYDARGRKVRTLEEARLTGRTGELVWNGRDDANNRVRIGIYVILFEAVQTYAGVVNRFKEPVVLARPLD